MPRESTDGIKISREMSGALARISLDRPPINVMDIPMMSALGEAVDAVARDADVRILVVDAAPGCRAFTAGVDVKDHTDDRVGAMLEAFHGVFRSLERVEVPTMAVVDGAALGGGCELILAFDLVVASTRAKFGQPEIKLGAFAPVACVLLSQIVGPRNAADWLFTGRAVPAWEAARAGLVSRVVPAEELAETADSLAGEICAMSGAVLRLTKRAWREGSRPTTFEARLAAVEKLYLAELMATSDAHEGLAAFIEKREPAWLNS